MTIYSHLLAFIETACHRKFHQSILGCCCTLLIVSCSSAIDDDWEEYRTSVIRLVAESDSVTATGTAFSVNNDGYYLTNQHVVVDAIDGGMLTAVESVAPASKLHPASVVWSDADKDLAIVHVPSWTNKPLSFVESEKVRVNDAVLSIGFPGSSDAMSGSDNPAWTIPTFKRGIISKPQTIPETALSESLQIFEHSATVNSGNSGGPLVDECGDVIGVNVAKASASVNIVQAIEDAQLGYSDAAVETAEGAYFAIKADEAMAALGAQSIDYKTSSGRCLGETLNPKIFVAGLFGLLFIFGAGLLGLFLYIRKTMPSQPFNLKTVSRLIIKGEPVSSYPDKPAGPAVFRGAGGEIVHRNAMRLVSVSGASISAQLLPGQTLRIGREPNDCDVVVVDDAVSRNHADVTLEPDGESVRVLDLKSTRGTYIDGQQVTDVKPGDVMSTEQRLIVGSEDCVFIIIAPEEDS